MESNPLDLQKKFSLFEIGDVECARVVSLEDKNDWIQLKTAGGCIGQMSMEWSEPLNIRIGSMLEVQVAELQDGIPVFIPSDKEMFKRPQKATVKHAAPHGVVVVFDYKDKIGYYSVADMIPIFKENQKVVAEGIELVQDTDGDYFKVNKLSLMMEDKTAVAKVVPPAKSQTRLLTGTKKKEGNRKWFSGRKRRFKAWRNLFGPDYKQSRSVVSEQYHGFRIKELSKVS